MCLEDLRIARGYQKGQSVTHNDVSDTTAVFTANPNRVGIIVCSLSPGSNSQIRLSSDPAFLDPYAAVLDTVFPSRTFSVYEYGQVIMQPVFITGGGVGTLFRITELICQIETIPFARMSDKNKV